MATEDFTTYVETDPLGHLSITASTITGTGITLDEDTYCHYDKGVGHFSGDFTHLITTNVTNVSGGSACASWALTNDIDDVIGLIGASKSFLRLQHNSGNTYILTETVLGTQYSDSGTLTDGQTYYNTIERDESIGTYGQLTCKIYSDSDRTVLVDTLLVTLHVKLDLQYIFGLLSVDNNNASTCNLTVSNMDLGEGLVSGFPFFFDIGHY